MKGVLTGSGKRHLGHNPGSSYAIFAMLALVLALAVTGWLMSQGNESIKEVHEILAYATLAVIGAHVLGVIVHTMRYRENLTASMIVGTKSAEQSAAISSSQPVVAVLFLLVTGAWAYGLLSNYDAATKTTRVPLLGTSLQLGENEGNESETHSPRVAGEKEDDND
jgi:Ni,Fe-hydrogenase I cytochrome b subunit